MIVRNRQDGYTIVELMVALAVGLLVVASLITVFVNSSRTRNEIEKASQQNENGRYALQLLSDDLRNAGYLAQFNVGQLSPPTTKPDPCVYDVPSLRTALRLAVQGYDNGATLSCISDVKANTDILVVRRTSTCAVGEVGCDAAVTGAPYFQASGCSSIAELASNDVTKFYVLDTDTTKLTLHQKDCLTVPPGTLASRYQYRVHIYFVANNDKSGDQIPTLKRAELDLTNPSGWTIVPLVEGIENLQIEYGIDTATPTTGAPALYTANPDLGCPPAPAATCVGYWQNTVAAKIYVLARNTVTTGGFSDLKSYTLGLNADGTANTVAAPKDAYKRHVFETVVRLNNTAGRNTP